MNRLLYIFVFIFCTTVSIFASHIKAGEVIVGKNPNNSLNYNFEFIMYYDATNITTDPTQGGFINVTRIGVNMGDGSGLKFVDLSAIEYYTGQNIAKGTYRTNHTYSGAGTYTVFFSESWRIDGIKNMASSGNTDLHIDARIIINPFFGANTSPRLTFPPLDLANKNKIYTHNPGAYDPDGDSLVFDLIPPKVRFNTDVNGYVSPADPRFGGVSTDGTDATFTINRKTGEIIWNTPGQEGFYNIAIRISEYRRGILLGYIVRDMQITVINSQNNPPLVVSQDSVCLEAQKASIIDFTVSDLDAVDRIIVGGYGSAFQESNKPQFLGLVNPVSNPYSGQIAWTPSCDFVREQPYQILINAEDNVPPSTRLSNIKTILTKVRGPKPIWNNIEITSDDNVRLTWQPYNLDCMKPGIKLRIYRAECDSIFNFDPCKIAKTIPSNYQLIGETNSDVSEFVDNNNGLPFKSSVKYFYTIVAFFPELARGVSFPADIRNIIFSNKSILINAVDVLDQNIIKVSWTNPDLAGTTPNYGFEIQRSTDNQTFTQVFQSIALTDLTQTEYIDNDNVDVAQNQYYYRIIHYVNNDPLQTDTSSVASHMTLSYQPLISSVRLTWSGVSPYNIIKVKIFDLRANRYIDSVSNTNSYLIENLKSCDTTEYYITTVQRYCTSTSGVTYEANSYKIKVTPLTDKNIVFDLSLEKSYCDQVSCDVEVPLPVSDTLSWPDLRKSVCDNILGYNIYFKSILSNDFVKIGNTTDTFFVSSQTITRVGCYQVRLIIQNQNNEATESSTSNEICVNNDCYCFNMPNIITPNGDQINDLLLPLKYTRFVKALQFTIYNRWGIKVFESSDKEIRWDAKNVEAGVYFYVADILKYSLDGNEKDELKGYITVQK